MIGFIRNKPLPARRYLVLLVLPSCLMFLLTVTVLWPCLANFRTTVKTLRDVRLPAILDAQRTRTNLSMLRKQLDIIVKADVQGSAEAVKQSLEKISNDEVRVKVIHAGVGAINKSDVMLANAGNAIIIGFNVRPDPVAKEEAAQCEVEMRMYRVIYDAINDVTDAMKGMLAPKIREVEQGRLEVRQVYKISSVGLVAGSYVQEGKITRNSKIRVVRDGIVVTEDEIASLRRFKDDVKEVAQGYECGVTLEKFADIKEGDIFEAYILEEYRD